MSKRLRTAAVAVLLLGLGPNAGAHRIDDYLQASQLTVEPGRLRVALRLIAGARVSGAVIAAIDRDGDGLISAVEQQRYAQRVVNDQSITLDGHRLQPTLRSWAFPPVPEMRQGTGEIRIDFDVALPSGRGRRTVVIANRHLSGGSVYLANALSPQDPAVRITAQRRDARQSIVEVDYDR